MRTDLLQVPLLQGEGSRSIVGTDPDFATSKKFPTDEDVQEIILKITSKESCSTFSNSFSNLGVKFLLAICVDRDFRELP
jgi:hypothetical protein